MRVLLTIALTLALLPMLSTFAPGGQVAGFTTASPAVANKVWYQSVGRASATAGCEKSTVTELAQGWTQWAPSWDTWVNGGKGGFVCNRQITWAYDTPPVTCATGGICRLGDIGPGGGLVFLISGGRTYEMAPKTWGANETAGIQWCSDATNPVTTGLTVGTGSANTTAMLTNAGLFVACTASAPNVARGYSGGGFTDWFLPSQDELNAMCNYSRNPTTPAAPGVACGTLGVPTTQDATFLSGSFGFAGGTYWSSSQYGASTAWSQNFDSGIQYNGSKRNTRDVRPVRAF
jgi:hypothetical protein